MSDVDESTTPVYDSWPFGEKAAPFKGFLRSIDPMRDGLILDCGYGIRIYPSTTTSPARRVDAGLRTCSHCTTLADCVHLWEDDFRFGRYRGVAFVPPPRLTRIHEKGGSWDPVQRYLPRPNPEVDGLRAATHDVHAREHVGDEVRELLLGTAALLRARSAHQRLIDGISNPVGRPPQDVYDAAAMAILRLAEGKSYVDLQREINEADGENSLVRVFRYPRVNEAMTRKSFEGVLNEFVDHFSPLFSDVCEVTAIDGMLLSSARTDAQTSGNSSKAKRRAQLELHVMYDMRWGFITGFSLTWYMRGRGSAESPQFPLVFESSRKRFPNINLVMADGAYGSDRNFAEVLKAGGILLSAVKFRSARNVKYLTEAQAQYVIDQNRPDGPLMDQVFRFRAKAEGCHETQRRILGRHLMTVPDRRRRPNVLKDGEKRKKDPNLAEAGFPEDAAERRRIIETEQFTGQSCHNEMLCRQAATLVRAIVRARRYYGQAACNVNDVRPFRPRAEDEYFSVYRPAISKRAA